jgi:hypothetical protein
LQVEEYTFFSFPKPPDSRRSSTKAQAVELVSVASVARRSSSARRSSALGEKTKAPSHVPTVASEPKIPRISPKVELAGAMIP